MQPSRRLAARSGAAVDLTPCGRVLLHVGPLALKLEPCALVAIHAMLGEAIERMADDIEASLDDEPRSDSDFDSDPEWLRRIVDRGRNGPI